MEIWYVEPYSISSTIFENNLSAPCSSCICFDTKPLIGMLSALCIIIYAKHGFNFWTLVIIPPATKLGGGILDSACLSVCLSVCPSVRPSVCPLTFRVRPVASTVPDGFFPYLVQMITSMRRCAPCDDLWPWPISSRSFDLDLENRVRSVASTVLEGFL